MIDSSASSLQDRLTKVLAANAEVAERVDRSEGGCAVGCGSETWPQSLAQHTLAKPDSYFSAALSRVQKALRADVPHYSSVLLEVECRKIGWMAALRAEGVRLQVTQPTLREALQALWLAVLEAGCEPCERCSGVGKILVVGKDRPEATHEEPCPDCTGTGYKLPRVILHALAGTEASRSVRGE